jgi:ParB family chromosome partitioning protein
MKKSLLSGLGLDSLDAKPAASDPVEPVSGLFVPLDKITPDANQPRKLSAEADDDLKLLAESILQHGILQPITVKSIGGGEYQIIAGERRWRAAQIAAGVGKRWGRKGYDLQRIPVFIRNPESDEDKLEMQMVENLARTDMTPSDIGRALQRLVDKTKLSKAELARRMGRSETWVKSVLASASPEAQVVADRIGVPVDVIGAGEALRMVSWAKDAEKQVVLDWIAKEISGGRPYSRALIDDAEERYEIGRRFPRLATRMDLTLDDLRTWQKLWSSPDPAQRAVAERVLNGATLADAMQAAPVESPAAKPVEPEPTEPEGQPVITSTSPEWASSDEFEIDDAEAGDAAAARAVISPPPTPGNRATQEEAGRATMDAAGLSMESERDNHPVADSIGADMMVRIPSDIIRRLLDKVGTPADLTVDADTVLRAIETLSR